MEIFFGVIFGIILTALLFWFMHRDYLGNFDLDLYSIKRIIIAGVTLTWAALVGGIFGAVLGYVWPVTLSVIGLFLICTLPFYIIYWLNKRKEAKND